MWLQEGRILFRGVPGKRQAVPSKELRVRRDLVNEQTDINENYLDKCEGQSGAFESGQHVLHEQLHAVPFEHASAD